MKTGTGWFSSLLRRTLLANFSDMHCFPFLPQFPKVRRNNSPWKVSQTCYVHSPVFDELSLYVHLYIIYLGFQPPLPGIRWICLKSPENIWKEAIFDYSTESRLAPTISRPSPALPLFLFRYTEVHCFPRTSLVSAARSLFSISMFTPKSSARTLHTMHIYQTYEDNWSTCT